MEAIFYSVHIVRYFTPPPVLRIIPPARQDQGLGWVRLGGMYGPWSTLKFCGLCRHYNVLILADFASYGNVCVCIVTKPEAMNSAVHNFPSFNLQLSRTGFNPLKKKRICFI
jgi:hypothetical protein